MSVAVYNMPEAEYHGNPALGSTSIKTLALKTPAHFAYDREHPRHSDEFDLGKAAHSLILEDDLSRFEIIDAANWMTKAAKEARDEARSAGKVPLLTKEFAEVVAMRDAVMDHPLARNAFTDHKPEVSVFWQHETGTALKARADALHEGGKRGNLIVDLKTAADASQEGFARSSASFGYHLQQAHYQRGFNECVGDDFTFLFVVVEKSPPYLTAVYELDPDDVARGAELVERGIRIYNECVEKGEWPGYPTAKIQLPRWSKWNEEELLND